jgi:hypothetical protein
VLEVDKAMKVPLSEFPHQPKQLPCCGECKGKKKDCEPNPMNCIDFFIQNSDFIKKKEEEAFS